MSWFTSWLPPLPSLNFVVPAGIQGRFISFILKRSLGHLFKPGQLNSPQIDSQIGSGYVQINDLELDELAINSYLQGTPLVLEAGTVQSVTARIPWPNPLTSTIGASVNSLRLKFRVAKISQSSRRAEADLAESVLSVAESFVHDELTDQEEAGLWESIHSSAHIDSEENGVPGGLDPFISNEEEMQADPTGISLFATLIERLLARFEFDARDIQVSITDSDNITLRFCLAEIRYSTTSQPDVTLEGIRRTLTLKGIDVFTTNHFRPSIPASPSTTRPASPNRASSEDGSPRSSNSSLDEETEMRMSQSIAVFPPRPASPSDSMSSSIYHSVVEESRAFDSSRPEFNHQGPDTCVVEATERRFMSLGSTPISVHLTTPFPGDAGSDRAARSPKENIHVALQSGALAIAVLPWQLVGLNRLVEKLTSSPSSTTPKTDRTQPSPQSYAFEVSLDIRGICILLLSSPGSTEDESDGLDEYFVHSFTPPALSTGYSRILVDTITGHATVSSSDTSFRVNIADMSVFQFFGKSCNGETSESCPHAIPVLITDPYLRTQYPRPHNYPNKADPPDSSHSQPTLRIVDRRNPRCATFGSKLSHWRSRSQHTTPAKAPSTGGQDPCLSFSLHRSLTKRSRNPGRIEQRIALDIVPLSIFVDLEMSCRAGGIFSFLDTFLLEKTSYDQAFPDELDSSQNSVQDPSSDTEFESAPHNTSPRAPPSQGKSHGDSSVSSTATLKLVMIRVSVLVPSPPGQQARSGLLIVDLHDIEASNPRTMPPQHQVRFEPAASQYQQPRDPGNLIAQVQCRRIVLGCSSALGDSATAILSIGSLLDGPEQSGPSLIPVINILQPNADGAHPQDPQDPQSTITVDIPSIYASIDKNQWDALQYWIDDLSQTLERIGSSRELSESQNSKNTSIIGSRYFAKSQRGSTYDSSKSVEMGIKLAVLVNVTELYVRCHLPREDSQGNKIRPFNVMGSDFSASVEMHANGKLAALVSFMDALVQDTEASGNPRTFLSLTSARSLETSLPRPLIKVRFISSVIPETTAKETKISISLCNFTFDAYPDIRWIADLIAFTKAPPGTFESVVPSERTCISLKIIDGSIRAFAPSHPGALVLSIGGLHFATDIVGNTTDSSFRLDISFLAVLAIDDIRDAEQQRVRKGETDSGVVCWKSQGYALLAEISSTKLHYQETKDSSPEKQVLVDGTKLKIHACADTIASVGEFGADLAAHFNPPSNEEIPTTRDTEPAILSSEPSEDLNLTRSIDEYTFKRIPEIGPTPDMIYDDLPTNLDYLDESFGAAGGLRELTDDDLDEFDIHEITTPTNPAAASNTGVISSIGGETIKMLHEGGINVVEDYYDDLPREDIDERQPSEGEALRVRIRNCDVSLLLYDGYDWPRTRKTIEEEVKEMRKRLAKIRQLVANGQTPEPVTEDTSALLFNSVYIGLHEDVDASEPAALIAAIDEELKEDFETGTQSSWQTLQHPVSAASAAPRGPGVRVHGKKLTRARGPSIEFCLSGVNAEMNKYGGNNVVVSRTFVAVRDMEILDHIKTSTWKKFLTAMRSDSKGNIRETGANMVRIELHSVRPAPGHPSEEARLRAKILPLRLYVDQDAVDFLKKFFSFKDPNSVPKAATTAAEKEAYIQMAEIFPIDLKLDYKPRRVDYRALREGRTIELMNFFHFDGAEMTLRHITLSGVTGWPKLFEMLNDLWTPDVKATQLVEVISGVAPIRSMVNVGSGVADLVLLPISQYKKDGRIVRGVQKGATAFVKSTALEAIKMGARLATGTQVILEQAEGILGGDFESTVTAETVQPSLGDEFTLPHDSFEDDDPGELISKYAQQPADIKEGVQTAYKSLKRNLNSAAQTILAVPMEVYERSGNEGPVRSVVRAVPIAVLKPMIGATEAVSKTLLGLHNTLDPDVRHENEAKYKNR